MRRNALILASATGLLFSIAACESTERKKADERAQANREVNEVGQDIERAGERAADETQQAGKKIGDAAEELAAGRYERFEAYDNESSETFASRADAAIARLETDLQQAMQKVGTNTDAKDDLDDAKDAIEEAKKDVADVRTKTGMVIDDGRLGVAMNINQAQRQLSAAYDEMSQAKM